MNERLHQLMRQAQSEAYANACAKNKTQRPQNNTIWNEFPEVFAELIIREAAQFVSGSSEVYTQAEQDACVRAAIGLKKYFGIEE